MSEAFAFGENWQSFVKRYLTPERVDEAVASLRAFCGEEAIRGKTFLDIGCGSGLFSLAALKLGAARVVSFDVDKNSVACTQELWQREGGPSSWSVYEGSVLDPSFLEPLGHFDMVYSWGVLHHTGQLWQAVENAMSRVADRGSLYIAIYNKADGFAIYPDGRAGSSRFWAWEKKMYNKLPTFLQRTVDGIAMAGMVVLYLLSFRNPVRIIRGHKKLRGMSWATDIRDWLGGHPYEPATVAEVFRFVHERGFTLENLISNNGLLNNEFLFRRDVAA